MVFWLYSVTCNKLSQHWSQIYFSMVPEVDRKYIYIGKHSSTGKFVLHAINIANFWLERDYLTVKVTSEGTFKDKNNGAGIFKIGWSMVKL